MSFAHLDGRGDQHQICNYVWIWCFFGLHSWPLFSSICTYSSVGLPIVLSPRKRSDSNACWHCNGVKSANYFGVQVFHIWICDNSFVTVSLPLFPNWCNPCLIGSWIITWWRTLGINQSISVSSMILGSFSRYFVWSNSSSPHWGDLNAWTYPNFKKGTQLISFHLFKGC